MGTRKGDYGIYKTVLSKGTHVSNYYQLPEVKSWDLIPASKDGNPPPKAGNPVKAEKNEVAPRFLLPRGPRRVPKKSSNGSSGNKHMHFVKFCSMSLFHGKAVIREQDALEKSQPQLS